MLAPWVITILFVVVALYGANRREIEKLQRIADQFEVEKELII